MVTAAREEFERPPKDRVNTSSSGSTLIRFRSPAAHRLQLRSTSCAIWFPEDDKGGFSDVALVRKDTDASVTPRDVKGQFEDRLRVYRDNRLPERKPDGILVLIWRVYNDKILILLTVAAVISLALGIYESVEGGSGVDWVEGVAICVAILIVVTVGAANDWQKERQFVKLNRRVSFSCTEDLRLRI